MTNTLCTDVIDNLAWLEVSTDVIDILAWVEVSTDVIDILARVGVVSMFRSRRLSSVVVDTIALNVKLIGATDSLPCIVCRFSRSIVRRMLIVFCFVYIHYITQHNCCWQSQLP